MSTPGSREPGGRSNKLRFRYIDAAEAQTFLELPLKDPEVGINGEGQYLGMMERALAAPVVLADPIDLSKMLDIPPGLTELPGVASILMKYYARDG